MAKIENYIADMARRTHERDVAYRAYEDACVRLDDAKDGYARALSEEELYLDPLCTALQDDPADLMALHIAPRWYSLLGRANIRTVGDVARMTGADLLTIKYVGVAGVKEVKAVLAIRAARQAVATVGG